VPRGFNALEASCRFGIEPLRFTRHALARRDRFPVKPGNPPAVKTEMAHIAPPHGPRLMDALKALASPVRVGRASFEPQLRALPDARRHIPGPRILAPYEEVPERDAAPQSSPRSARRTTAQPRRRCDPCSAGPRTLCRPSTPRTPTACGWRSRAY
jgi:hypothetical protein